MGFIFINFARALERLYWFCASDEPAAMRGRADCEAQYNRMAGKPVMDSPDINKGLKPPTPILTAPFRIALYILLVMGIFIFFGGHL